MDIGPDVRRFTLFDAMVLVAAAAVVLTLSEGYELYEVGRLLVHVGEVARGIPPIRGRPATDLIHDPEVAWALGDARGGFVPVADLPGEITMGWVLFARPGPQLSVQIPEALCLAIWPPLGILGLALLALRLRVPRPGWSGLFAQPGFWACIAPPLALAIVPAMHRYAGLVSSPLVFPGAVAACWLALGMTRRWCPEPSWIDRSGRVIGLLWLLTLPLWLWVSWQS